MLRKLLVLLCLATIALAQPIVSVEDIVFREDDYNSYPNDPNYDPMRQPTLRVSAVIRNETKASLNKLTVHVVYVARADGKELMNQTETLPELKPGKEFLYWAPPYINPGRQFVKGTIEVLDGTKVLATRSASQ